jgi:hypothetical protein
LLTTSALLMLVALSATSPALSCIVFGIFGGNLNSGSGMRGLGLGLGNGNDHRFLRSAAGVAEVAVTASAMRRITMYCAAGLRLANIDRRKAAS